MASAEDFRRIALSLEGTTEAPHFDRTAFRVRRIYATLAADGRTANLMFSPEEQALKCEVAPDAFVRIANTWGARGATTARLSALTVPELHKALETAWHRGCAKPRQRPRR
jgi:YjbR